MVIKSFIKNYIKLETFAGLLLISTSAIALIFANVELLIPAYHYIQHIPIGITIDNIVVEKSLLHWVNDGLMTLFFFLISLEIKREVQTGELSSMKKAMLPVIGAIGGMVIPAGIFIFANYNNPENLRGWAIPTATDIAFALGVLTLIGKRVPLSLKIFLTTLAIVDDLGAILILAVFYSTDLNTVLLSLSAVVMVIMLFISYHKIISASISLFLGFILWALLLESGIHPTIAGVVTALCVPRKCNHGTIPNPMEHLEHRLHGWVTFLIIPLFAFVNAGVTLRTEMTQANGLTMGIFLGLFFGKQLGIFSVCSLAIKLKIAHLPNDIKLIQLYGASVLCGIGFTMSLFIGSIPFGQNGNMDMVRIGVLSASVLSAILGSFILYISSKK